MIAVKLELMRAEGRSSEAVELVPVFELDSFGLDEVRSECGLHATQLSDRAKLHACTDTNDDGKPNDRSLDLIDIILAREVLSGEGLSTTKAACVEVFGLRDRHAWPPTARVERGWPEQFQQEAEEIGSPSPMCKARAERAQEIVD